MTMMQSRTFDLRTWQGEAFRGVLDTIENKRKDYLCVATPGAGKTKFALAVAYHLRFKRIIDRVVIVTPSDNLKRQWAETAATFAGLDIDPDFKNAQGIEARDYQGIAITYALLGQDKHHIHQGAINKYRTLVILDEIHHAGDQLTWGEAVKTSFEGATFRLGLSGTPFRSDANEIPFITYDNGTSKADYTYTYDRAIKEDVCRPVYFSIYEGQMKWKVGNLEFEHSFKDYLTPDQVSKRLKTSLNAKGDYVRGVLEAADQKLTEVRTTHPNAAGLIFAATQRHANEIADVLQHLTGNKPPVVISENTDSTGVLEQFRDNSERWLVSVKMVSEGVDIPRLRIGVYFTNVKAELFFRQAVGRFVRVIKGLQSQDAFIFVTADKDIVKMAQTISEEREHALEDLQKKAGAREQQADKDLFGNDYIPAMQGKFTPLGSTLTDCKTIAINIEVNSGARHTVVKTATEHDPVFIQKQRIKERCNQIAKIYAVKMTNGNRNVRPDFRAAHSLWLHQGGKNMETETVTELLARQTFYENLIRR